MPPCIPRPLIRRLLLDVPHSRHVCKRTPLDAMLDAPFTVEDPRGTSFLRAHSVNGWDRWGPGPGPMAFNQKDGVSPTKVVVGFQPPLVYIPIWKSASTSISSLIYKNVSAGNAMRPTRHTPAPILLRFYLAYM